MVRSLSTFDLDIVDSVCLVHSLSSYGDENQKCCQSGFHFASSFVEELYNTYVILGVYFDELGNLQISNQFFEKAQRICGIQSGLEVINAKEINLMNIEITRLLHIGSNGVSITNRFSN